MTPARSVLIVIFGILVQLIIGFLTLSARTPHTRKPVDHTPVECNLDKREEAVFRFAKLLRFPSLSSHNTATHVKQGYEPVFDEMLTYLETTYETVWSKLQVTKLGRGGYTRLLKWEGSDTKLLPILFISHYDVVPVTEGTESDWLHGPFSGDIADGYVWGRGSLDIKFSVSAMLEAITEMLQQGYTPRRTLYFVFGHDEEVGGRLGSGEVARYLADQGVRLDVVIDEGGLIIEDGMKPFTTHPIALVGTAEKLYTTIEVNVSSAGGHASMPPTNGKDVGTQIAKVLSYVHRHPFPPSIHAPVSDFLRGLMPYVGSKVVRTLLFHCEAWPWRWLLSQGMSLQSPETSALVRTTIAATSIQAGVADNVLPQHGTITFNLRSHPDVPREELLDYMKTVIIRTGVNGTAALHKASYMGPKPGVAPATGRHFFTIRRAIQEVWRRDNLGVAVLPFLLAGSTDSKHYSDLSEGGVLRFVPYMLNKTAGDLTMVHGTNEKVAVGDFKRAICTYERFFMLFGRDLSA
mmetsp:Transcript_36717/g.81684  ORF Transcript_36717/g.81684 Transcript_36717/m.81684 type:complete len:520 (-) Transcript_36717:537-2096(-)|eukprot:CAMPEP_0202902814 /NCGR_PEP_ID=MMETSP1392-20130828/17062_1 /ASSEMBLY_ACC=CAM_ASM_000868 /TAXON_ID=225041 /ORGANISM="Chlamydomonas chlamydogama, Strain SAG 11-48b" /LENGTH=519 /DNA_ID=CAMNT_0049589621 /DNA_START=84 /DNA_END=1643 /DNA_ORIENTATION=-